MPSPRVLTFTLVLALAWPAAASASGVRLASRDEPLVAGRTLAGGVRVLPARTAPSRFNLVGLHWRGTGEVAFRTSSLTGRWSPWRTAQPEAEDGPDATSREAEARRGWRIGNPYWTGAARRIQYRLSGRVVRLRTHFLWSAPVALRRLAIAGTPGIISRRAWGASESIVRGRPSYARRLAFSVVHHTAGAQPSTRAHSAAIVRAIQAYHVRSNGWDDIGYNFLVDRFGQIFEGRGGGVTRNVVGAHAKGFNTGSVGVAVIGTFSSAAVSARTKEALVALLAWRLDVGHVDPLRRISWISGGSPRFPEGTRVSIRTVSGHRDTGYTSCPGNLLYAGLPDIARRAAARGLPKLYEPVFTGALGGAIRFTARLSSARAWTVTVSDGEGKRVAGGAGAGRAIDWTWGSSGIPPGRYSYAIAAGPDVRPATGSLGAIVRFDVARLRASPPVLTPNADGVRDRTRIRFVLTKAASARVWVRDAAGELVANVVRERSFPAGAVSIRWGGRRLDGRAVADGRYEVVVDATSGTERITRSTEVVVDRTLGAFTARPAAFSPNGNGRLDTTKLSFELARSAHVVVRIRAGLRLVATPFSGTLAAGRRTFSWDGRSGAAIVPDGRYRAAVSATTELGTRRLVVPVRVDTVRPHVSAVSATRRSGGTLTRFTLDEPSRVVIWIDWKPFRISRGAGRFAVWRDATGSYVRIVAWDLAANRSRAVWAAVRR